MSRHIETKENETIEFYTRDGVSGKLKKVAEFSANGGGLILGSAGVDGVAGTASDNIKIHRGGSRVIQFVKGDDITPDGQSAPKEALIKLSGVTNFDYIIGTSSQVAEGVATHSSFSSILTSLQNGDTLLLIGNSEDIAPINIDKRITLIGLGLNSGVSQDFNLVAGSSKSMIKYTNFLGDMTLANGANHNIITDCWMASGHIITDNNTEPNNLITVLQED